MELLRLRNPSVKLTYVLAIGWTGEEAIDLRETCEADGVHLDFFHSHSHFSSELWHDYQLVILNCSRSLDTYEKIIPLLKTRGIPTIVFEEDEYPPFVPKSFEHVDFQWDTLPVTRGKIQKCLANLEQAEKSRRSAGQEVSNFHQFIQLFQKTIHHELNTPISVIKTSLHILEHYGSKLDDVERGEQLLHARAAVDGLESIIADICLFSEVSNTLDKPSIGPLDFEKIISEAVSSTQPKNTDYKNRIVVAHPESRWMVNGNARLINEALKRILANALENSSDSVRVEYERSGTSVVLHIVDTGVGIEENKLKSIFEPYTRFGEVDAKRGIGLGLPIAKRCLDLSGCSISVKSSYGEGSTFSVWFKL